jgi:hypothetical protein
VLSTSLRLTLFSLLSLEWLLGSPFDSIAADLSNSPYDGQKYIWVWIWVLRAEGYARAWVILYFFSFFVFKKSNRHVGKNKNTTKLLSIILEVILQIELLKVQVKGIIGIYS